MSKTHVQQSQSELDDELDQFLKTKKVASSVSSPSEEISLFGNGPAKKKSHLEQVIQYLKSQFSRIFPSNQLSR